MSSFDPKIFFGAEGPLAKAMAGFEPRPQQAVLGQEILSALQEGKSLLAEAGTGTGKTLAYLAPAVAAGGRVTVSTGTKNLQDQILDQDLPLLANAMNGKVSYAVLKGRSNYLCLYRLERFKSNPEFDHPADVRQWPKFQEWAESTQTGIRGDWQNLPELPGFWPRMDARAETCLGHKCPVYDQCHLVLARQEAASVQVVVINHHLLFADLAMKAKGGDLDFGVIPDYGNLIIDEAHLVEDIAGPFFGARVSTRMWRDWQRDFLEVIQTQEKKTGLLARHAGLDLALAKWGSECADDFDRLEMKQLIGYAPGLPDQCENLIREAGAIQASLAGLEDSQPFSALDGRINELRQNLATVLGENESDEIPQVRWASRRRGNLEMMSCPVEVGTLLASHLYPQVDGLVLTSATLSTDDSFAYLKQRLGLDDSCREIILESPYDHQTNTALYIPDLPMPNEPGFRGASMEQMEMLVELSDGGAFLLFASHASLQAAAQYFRERTMRSLYVQGELPRNKLLQEFRNDGNGVLLGTTSFWQGVDVRGSALRLVVLEKIPFAVPDDPLVKARRHRVELEGGNAFMDYQVPHATLLLKQGLGRLLRSQKDRGLLAILDARLYKRRYGKTILKSLPEIPIVRRKEDLESCLHLFRV